MSTHKISPDDPRLTAYALGELTGGERVEFEALLAQDPSAWQTIAEIRALGGQLEAALGEEPVPATDAPTVRTHAETQHRAAKRAPESTPLLRRFRSSQLYYLAGGLAAAGFVALIAVKGPQLPPVSRAKPIERSQPAAAAAATTAGLDARAGGAADPIAPRSETLAEPAATGPLSNEVALAQPAPGSALTAASHPAAMAMVDEAASAGTAGAPTPAVPAPTPGAVSPLVGQGLVAQSQALLAAKSGTAGPGQVTPDASVPAMRFPKDAGAASFEARRFSQGEAKQRHEARLTRARAELQRRENAARADTSADASSLVPVNEVPVVLSPFMVEAPVSQGYATTTTLAGARMGGTRTFNTEAYAYRPESDFVFAAAEPLSTFSADVDTASYANVRRFIAGGRLPPPDAVRIEELLNAFAYDYAAPVRSPAGGDKADEIPFAASLEVAAAPWAPAHRLVRIGIRGRDVPVAERGPANLVFLLDVSGSMSDENKLPLVKQAMKRLLTRLRADDRVAIVTYAGTSGMALPSTPLSRKAEIEEAIDALQAGGSTNGAMGIQLAYDVAKANFVAGGVNRVVLCTDGDFNVGTTSEGSLMRLIREKAATGVFLSVFGFGMGNLKDSMLQQVADAGNGNYGYIDTLGEAERRLVGQVNGTLVTIAKDVKLQVEFNPAKVSRYRLIGYEKRRLAAADFKNDAVDAGEIGAGHTVTALYEIQPAVAGAASAPTDDESRPQRYMDFATAPARRPGADEARAGELLTLRIRYKLPDGLVSRKLEFSLTDRGAAFEQASGDFKFASAVAAFGMILRDSAHKGSATLDAAISWAEAGTGTDADGSRTEFVELVRQAKVLAR